LKAYKYDLVEILWADAATESGWEADADLADGDEIATTVGFEVRETPSHVWVASTYDPNHSNAPIKIPKGMIRKRTVIKKKKA
jgi:hypothetical protein